MYDKDALWGVIVDVEGRSEAIKEHIWSLLLSFSNEHRMYKTEARVIGIGTAGTLMAVLSEVSRVFGDPQLFPITAEDFLYQMLNNYEEEEKEEVWWVM